MNKILITGSDGFIGRHYSDFLIRQDYTVITADKKSGVDLSDWNTVRDLPEVDCVIHLAAFNGTKNFYNVPYDVIRDNILPTQFLLDRYSGKVELFVHAGTCESYAGGVNLGITPIPTPEDIALIVDDVRNPRWSYGGSKIINELQVMAAYHQHRQNFQIIRFHNIYGPGQVEHFIPEVAQRFLSGDLTVYGGNESRSFCYIDDAIDAITQLMFDPGTYNQIFNVGCQEEHQILKVAEMIKNIIGVVGDLENVPGRPGSVNRRCPDISKLKKFIDWDPTTLIEDGLKLTLKNL